VIAALLALGTALAGDLPPAVPLAAVPLPPLEERTLPGGAHLWAVDRPGPLTDLEILWTLDSATLDARTVLAQRLLAALVEGELDEAALDELGAVVEVGRTAAGLRLRLQVPADGLAGSLSLLAPVLAHPDLPRPAVRRVRRAWREQERRAAQSVARVAERADLRACLPPGHLSARLPALADGRGLTPRDLVAAQRALLEEGGATVILVGGDPAALGGPLAFLGAPAPPAPQPPALPGPRVVLVHLPEAPQARVMLSFPLPGDMVPAQTDLLAAALGGGAAGLLDRRLREEEGLVYGVAVELQRWPGGGRLRIDTRTAAANLPRAAAALLASLGAVSAEDGAETRARATALFAAARTLDSPPALGGAFAARAALGADAAAWRRELDELTALPAGSLAAAASAVLRPEAATWVVLGDRDTLEPLLEEAGLPPTNLWSAARAVGERP
jgi:zinc protease